MACSRIPKCITRPYGLAPAIWLDAGKKEVPASIVVLLLSARSAEPPQNSGKFFAIAAITFPEAALVAISLSLGNIGNSLSQSAGNCLESNLFSN